jgi:hypothetical protein
MRTTNALRSSAAPRGRGVTDEHTRPYRRADGIPALPIGFRLDELERRFPGRRGNDEFTMNFSISGIVGANAAACACAAAAEQSRCAAPDWEHAQCACLRPHAHPGERERARADSFEALSRVQAASLAELGDLAHNVRCQVADLADDALSSKPMPVHGLRNVTGRMNGLAETLSRAARGYAGARTTVMLYPDVVDDLRTHKWTPRPDQGLDGVLPPVPIIELRDRRGKVGS